LPARQRRRRAIAGHVQPQRDRDTHEVDNTHAISLPCSAVPGNRIRGCAAAEGRSWSGSCSVRDRVWLAPARSLLGDQSEPILSNQHAGTSQNARNSSLEVRRRCLGHDPASMPSGAETTHSAFPRCRSYGFVCVHNGRTFPVRCKISIPRRFTVVVASRETLGLSAWTAGCRPR
jgi:hypothetical protein